METVSLGDFNSPSDQKEINKMIEAGKFTDSYAKLHPGDPGLSWDNRNPFCAPHGLPDRRLDYIFYRNGSNVLGDLKSIELTFTKPNEQGMLASDHYGVLATFSEG